MKSPSVKKEVCMIALQFIKGPALTELFPKIQHYMEEDRHIPKTVDSKNKIEKVCLLSYTL